MIKMIKFLYKDNKKVEKSPLFILSNILFYLAGLNPNNSLCQFSDSSSIPL